MMMNKPEFINKMAADFEITKKDAEFVIDTFTKCVISALAEGDSVKIIGFGTFEVRDSKERTGRNPATGEEIHIEASKRPAFKPGAAFKQKINGDK